MPQENNKAEKKNRFRKIEVRMWGDQKFRELSPIPPCGQGLWVYLLTGPHTGPIPGLFRIGRAAMAEELNWDIEAFDKAFAEAFQQGMVKADWKAKVVWIPKAILCNKPESPNVVRSWSSEWGLIPECDLKTEALNALKASIGALGEPYGKAFEEAFVKPTGKPSPKPSRKTSPNQEQEQEQDIYASATQVLDYLNQQANRNYKPVKANVGLIQKRIEEGASVDDCKAVIDRKTSQWLNDPKMADYLRPATLFNATKFAQYSGEINGNGGFHPWEQP